MSGNIIERWEYINVTLSGNIELLHSDYNTSTSGNKIERWEYICVYNYNTTKPFLMFQTKLSTWKLFGTTKHLKEGFLLAERV